MDTLTITQPDDWHLHLRDGAALTNTVPDAARNFARGMVMPNLSPPISSVAEAQAYRQRILAALPEDASWQPLMTLYLTDNTGIQDIEQASTSGIIHGIKYYPAGTTTNSSSGVTNIDHLTPVLEHMQKVGIPLQVHGEVNDPDIDIFDREAVFIDRTMLPLTERYPELKIIFEHVTTLEATQFVTDSSSNIGATITPQHLMFNRNELLAGGIRPHLYCLPVLKRNCHQQALIRAATSANPKFFLGTDSAPHSRDAKETACGCAGCYSHHAAIELYAEIFSKADGLDKLEGFAGYFGADFYGLPRNEQSITLRKQPWQLPHSTSLGDEQMIPLCAGNTLQWQVVSE